MTRNSASELAVVLAAHGERAGADPNAVLLAHRDAIAARGLFKSVTAGVLKGEPTLLSALDAAAESGVARIAVFPFFMAAGYFTTRVLPDRVASARLPCDVAFLPPLGLHPALPHLIDREATAAAQQHGVQPSEARLVLVGHGSKFGPQSADATRAASKRIGEIGTFREVVAAFIEEAPFIKDVLQGRYPRTIVIGFMSGEGLHGGEDIPQAIRESGADAVFAGVVGRSPDIPKLICEAITDAFPEP